VNKNNHTLVAIAGVVVIAAGGWMLFGRKTDDQSQIKSALENAVKASKEGRPGGVVEYLTNHIEINGVVYNVGPQFAKFIKQYHPDITLENIEPVIHGDHATVTSDLQLSFLAHSTKVHNVTFSLEKQTGTTWLVIPSHDWVVTGAVAPEEQYKQIISELPGVDNSPF